MEFQLIFGLIIVAGLGFTLLILNCLNDFYYYDKYKQMAKLNNFIINYYEKYRKQEYDLILNEFYIYLDKESKKQQKEFEKKLKKDFKENIKKNIENIY